MAAKKTTAAKIKEAKGMAAYRQKNVNQLQTGRQGDISQGPKGGIYVASQASRNKSFNSLTSSSKTAGRAKNVESKLKKAAASKPAAKPANKDLPTKKSMELVQKQFKQTNLDKKAGSRSKAGASTVAAVAKRFGVTAREARDIATAVGTAVQSARNPNVLGTKAKVGSPTRPTAGNVIKKQIKETITAAKTGKKGTTSPKLSDTGKKSTLDSGRTMPVFKYQEGKKRK